MAFWVVAISLAVTLVIGTITVCVNGELHLESLRSVQRQVYFMARSEARGVVTQMRQGPLALSTFIVPYPNGVVTIAVNQGAISTVQVTAHAGSATDVITFQYISATDEIKNWVDNAGLP